MAGSGEGLAERTQKVADWQGAGQEGEFIWRNARKEEPENGAGEVDLREWWATLYPYGWLKVRENLEGECWGKVQRKEDWGEYHMLLPK